MNLKKVLSITGQYLFLVNYICHSNFPTTWDFSLKNLGFAVGMSRFFLLQLRHCPSRGHGGLFSLHMPQFSLTLALTLLFSGHGSLFPLHMPRFSLHTSIDIALLRAWGLISSSHAPFFSYASTGIALLRA